MNTTLEESLLIVVVCDIRGFTGLQSRMNDYKLSAIANEDQLKDSLRAYVTYVTQTQQIARKIFFDNLGNSPDHKNVVKSTGDGFMIAVNLGPVKKDSSFRHSMPNGAEAIACKLASGLWNLVGDAEIKEPSSSGAIAFGELTHDFISKYGKVLGLKLPEKKGGATNEWTSFRVAGSMSMGFGFIGTNGLEQEDASGHPVNLAFRLCDKAGRMENKSPHILLDRRVARLLMEASGDNLKWKVEPHDEIIIDMKGIEENWCFKLDARR